MRKGICLFLLTFCLLLTACAPAAPPDPAPAPEASAPEETLPENPPTPEAPAEPELSQREKDWIEDIEFLREQYKERHLSPFYFRSEEEFDSKLDLLAAKVGELTDNDMYFELAAVVAGMGDIHTQIQIPESLYEQLLPFDIYYFGDRLYLTAYLKGYEQLAPYTLREIVAVNGVDITYLTRKAESIIDPYNSWHSKENFPFVGFTAAFYEWAAGFDARDTFTLQILNENQEVGSVEVPVISPEEYSRGEWVNTVNNIQSVAVIYQGDSAAYVDRSGGCVYLALGEMTSLSEETYRNLFEEIAGLAEEHPDCRKLAIDLRGNSGGYGVAVEYLQKHLHVLKELPFEQIYVLTNGYAASAAIECLTLFKEELDAVTVGEPTGQFTSFFMHGTSSDGVTFTLPHSQLSVLVATGWLEGDNPENTVLNRLHRLYEWENTIFPDVFIYQDIENIRQGKDSVLEWVLAQ